MIDSVQFSPWAEGVAGKISFILQVTFLLQLEFGVGAKAPT